MVLYIQNSHKIGLLIFMFYIYIYTSLIKTHTYSVRLVLLLAAGTTCVSNIRTRMKPPSSPPPLNAKKIIYTVYKFNYMAKVTALGMP